jgi:hypothetical protein
MNASKTIPSTNKKSKVKGNFKFLERNDLAVYNIGYKKGRESLMKEVLKVVDEAESGCANENPVWFATMECCKDELKAKLKKLEKKK